MNKKNREKTDTSFLKIPGVEVIQYNLDFNISIDSILLPYFATINKNVKEVIEFGCGNGIVSIILAKRSKVKIKAIDIQEKMCEIAKENIKKSELEERIIIVKEDIKDTQKINKMQSFDMVISNPPFFKEQGRTEQVNNNQSKAISRHEIDVTLEEIIVNGAYLLKNSGYFTMVHRASRLSEIISCFVKNGIQPKKICFCYTKKKSEAKVVLIEGIKNAKPGVEIMEPIYINNNDGSYTEFYNRLLQGENSFLDI